MILIGKNVEILVKLMVYKGEEIVVLLNGKVKLIIGKFFIVFFLGDFIYIFLMVLYKWINLYIEKSVVIFLVSFLEF